MLPSPTLPAMNNRMRMNFSFPCLMESMKRLTRIGVRHTVKVLHSNTVTHQFIVFTFFEVLIAPCVTRFSFLYLARREVF